jgi:hypothetical protein
MSGGTGSRRRVLGMAARLPLKSLATNALEDIWAAILKAHFASCREY